MKSNELDSELSRIEKCLCEVRKWMLNNFLKLNDSKTEFLIISSKHNAKKLDREMYIKIGESHIKCCQSAKNLGVIFDRFMSMEQFVNAKCQSAMYSLRCISKIRQCLDVDTARTLVQSLVISKLDYANSALYGVNGKLLKKLQIVQNSAARVITQVKRREHITPILFKLHWLPVTMRLKFKVLILCFKCLHGLAPTYLSNLLNPYVPSRSLRNSSNRLEVQRSSSKAGDQCFAIYGPQLWNSLPASLRTQTSLNVFKTSLKTHLFLEYYGS